jgi:hypothetical protein
VRYERTRSIRPVFKDVSEHISIVHHYFEKDIYSFAEK